MDSRFQSQQSSQGKHLSIARPGSQCAQPPTLCVYSLCKGQLPGVLYCSSTSHSQRQLTILWASHLPHDPVAQKTGVTVCTSKMLIAFLCKTLCLCSLPTPTKNLYSKSSGGWGLEIPVQTAQHLHNVKSFMLPGCFKLTMSFSNFHLHCLKCHTKDDSLFSPFL